MDNLRRYEKTKDAFNENFNFKDNRLFLDNLKIELIKEEIPNFIVNKLDKLTKKMSDFYDDVRFPNYDDCEDYASLIEKGNKNSFSKRLDNELNYGIKVLELGCGTGQLSLYLSRGNRTVYGIDISNGSLLCGEKFRRENNIKNTFFMKMDIFDLKFKKNYFDFTISNGVLHHTKNAKEAFNCLVEVTKPGGIIVVGLYHKYGRIFTKLKQVIAHLIGSNIFLFDRNSIRIKSKDKRKAWVRDQFFNPHETIHTPYEIIKWFEDSGVDFINLIPHCDDVSQPLLKKRNIPKLSKVKEFFMMLNRKQIQEGGFFVMIGRKRISN